jgi:phosphoribosylanthranilate isomerase
MTRVKICGITSLDDANMVAEAGAWALGLIFVPSSERRVEVAEAARIGSKLQRLVKVVGVFANAELDEVTELAELCALTHVQLHGDEGPAYCTEVARRTGAKVIKAVRARDKQSVRALGAYRDRVDFHLIDAYAPDKLGGTGETFAWELVKERAHTEVPLILSGGITADNAPEAVRAVQPFAVDSASGTESAPGRKDPAKVSALIRAVAQASPAEAPVDTPVETA